MTSTSLPFSGLAFGLMPLTLALAAGAVSAQPIYRCGSEYTRAPCAGGKPVEVDEPGTASAQRTAEARQVAAQERRLGDDMARDRRQREAALRPARATSLGPAGPAAAAAPASASLKPKKRARGKIRVLDEKDFTAAVPPRVKAPPRP